MCAPFGCMSKTETCLHKASIFRDNRTHIIDYSKQQFKRDPVDRLIAYLCISFVTFLAQDHEYRNLVSIMNIVYFLYVVMLVL